MPRSTHTSGVLFAGVASILWGLLPIALTVALGFASGATVVACRFWLAFVLLAGLMAWRQPQQLRAILQRPPLLGIAAGAALGGNYLGFMKGLELTTPSNTQIIMQTAPLALVVAGFVLFGERLRGLQWAGLAVAGAGLALFYHDQLAQLVASPARYHAGNLWIFASAMSWATYAVLQKRLVQQQGWNPQQLNLLIYGVPALMVSTLADWHELPSFTAPQWALMVFLGLNTLVAYGAIGEALKRIPANQVSVMIALDPVVTLGAMALLEAARVTWIAPAPIAPLGYAGAALVLVGAVMVVGRPNPTQPEHSSAA